MTTLDDRLAELAPLAGIIAREQTRLAPSRYDDARQEALIVAWRMLEAQPDKPAAYVHAAMRYACVAVMRGRPAFGSEGRQGWQDAHTSAGAYPTDEHGRTLDAPDPAQADALEVAERADEVRKAVRGLDPDMREVAFGVYWLDERVAQVAPIAGRPRGTLERRWSQVARPALRDALEAAA